LYEFDPVKTSGSAPIVSDDDRISTSERPAEVPVIRELLISTPLSLLKRRIDAVTEAVSICRATTYDNVLVDPVRLGDSFLGSKGMMPMVVHESLVVV
jgi:hypothetical protein